MNPRNRRLHPHLTLAVGLFALALMGSVAAQEKNDAEDARIAKLIEQLGDDEYDVRKAAEKKLIEIGEPALDQIKKAAKEAADADVKLRAIVLSATISKGLYGQIRTFTGHKEDIRSLAVSKDGKQFLSGSRDHNMILWDTDTGKEVRRFEGKGWAWSVAFSPDEKKALSSGGLDKTMRLWNIADGKEERQYTGNTSWVYGAAFSPDGKHVASSGAKDDCSIRIYETDTAKEVRKLEGHKGWVWKIAYSPDGKKIASAGANDKSFRIWDAETGNTLIEGKDAHDGNVVGVAFSPDGKSLLTAGRDLSVKLWDVEKGTLIRKYLGASDNVEAIAFSKDGKRFLAGETRIVHVFETETGKIVHRFEDHTDEVLAVAFLPDGRRAVSGGKDHIIRLWGIPK
jgi:WD40 repeat protein